MRRFGKILFVISLGFIFVFSQGKVTRESESLSGDRSFRFVVNHLSEFLDPMNNDRLCSLPEDLALGLDKATQLMASHPARFTFVKEHPELFAKYGNSIELSANASSNWDDPIFINSNEELKTSVIEAAGLVAAILWLRANPESTDRGVIDLSGQFQSCLDTRVKAFGVRDGHHEVQWVEINDGFKGRFWAIQNELSVEVTDRLEAAVPCEFGKAELSLLRINSSRVEEIANGFFRWVIPSEISYKCEHHQTSEKANLTSYLWLQRAKGADLELLDRTEVVLE